MVHVEFIFVFIVDNGGPYVRYELGKAYGKWWGTDSGIGTNLNHFIFCLSFHHCTSKVELQRLADMPHTVRLRARDCHRRYEPVSDMCTSLITR